MFAGSKNMALRFGMNGQTLKQVSLGQFTENNGVIG